MSDTPETTRTWVDRALDAAGAVVFVVCAVAAVAVVFGVVLLAALAPRRS